MEKNLYIDASHPDETRVVLKSKDHIEEYEYENKNKLNSKNNIYLGKISRIEPSLQAAFVNYGKQRHGFLAFNDVQSDYYQIPHDDKEKLKKEEEDLRLKLKEESNNADESIKSLNQNDGLIGTNGNVELINKNKNENPVAERNSHFNSLKKKYAIRRYRIQEVLKPDQIVLIQVLKDERGQKGAALTTLISYKKYPLEKIEELRIDVKKGSLLNLNLLDSQFQIKFENKRKIVESTIATKGKISFNDIKKISSLVGTKLDIFENLTLDSNLKTKINFIINNKFKLINKNYQIDGKINNLEFSLLHNKHIRNFIPTFNKNIKIKNSKINFNFPSADNQNQTLKLDGLINLSNKYEKINLFQSYNKNKKLFNINFFTNLNDSEISFPMLNYNKGKKNKAKLNANIDFVLKNFFLINSFEYEHDKNKIFLNNIKLNKNFEIYDFKRIEVLTHKDKKVNNNFKIIKSNQIIISGKVFDAEPILKSLYKNNTADREIFSKTVNSNVKVNFDKTLTGTFDIISDFSMIAEIKNGSYEKFILKGNYSKEDKIEISLYKIDDKTKTIEVVSDRATPFIKSLDFIKGFEGGKLVYDSTIFENSSKSNLLITNFKISKVPSLAKLLTLASLQGIADTLSGEGIRFESFEMKSNSQENILNIEDALAIGPAVSILLDGYVDNGKIVSLRGTLVPATKLNAIIASIPLVGDILVGKKTGDGVVGVSFKMKGPPKDIKTTVNPIKTLTPRFIIRAIEKAKKKSKTK